MSSLHVPKTDEKGEVIKYLDSFFKKHNLEVADKNTNKPWGAYFKFNETCLKIFKDLFYADFEMEEDLANHKAKYNPKVLLVEPGKRLSWQYHFRRSELWRVVDAPVAIALSENDNQPETIVSFEKGQLIKIPTQMRHRLIGLDNWGVVAEIWIHDSTENPSDEDDIIRVSDDFGR